MLSSHRGYSVCLCYIAVATVAATGTSTVFSLVNGKDAQKGIRDFPPCSTIWTLENMNVLQNINYFLTVQCSTMQQEPSAGGVSPDTGTQKATNPFESTVCRFSEKQKDYFSSKFLIGKANGQKVDTASVVKATMTARPRKQWELNRLFTNSEFLTRQQISVFFPRLV